MLLDMLFNVLDIFLIRMKFNFIKICTRYVFWNLSAMFAVFLLFTKAHIIKGRHLWTTHIQATKQKHMNMPVFVFACSYTCIV